jgi:hypothetical protein
MLFSFGYRTTDSKLKTQNSKLKAEMRVILKSMWVFTRAQFLLRQSDAHDPYLSNDAKISAVAYIKAPLLSKRCNSTL